MWYLILIMVIGYFTCYKLLLFEVTNVLNLQLTKSDYTWSILVALLNWIGVLFILINIYADFVVTTNFKLFPHSCKPYEYDHIEPAHDKILPQLIYKCKCGKKVIREYHH